MNRVIIVEETLRNGLSEKIDVLIFYRNSLLFATNTILFIGCDENDRNVG